MRKLLMSAAFVFLAVGCGESVPGAAVLRGADRVEVFRVKPDPVAGGAGETIGGFPVVATGPEQGAEFAGRLSRLLRGGGVTPNRKKCGLRPGVAYRVWSGDRAVEVLVCFECDVLWPHAVGSPTAESHREWQDFDPVRAGLLALTREALPDDLEIRAIPAVRK